MKKYLISAILMLAPSIASASLVSMNLDSYSVDDFIMATGGSGAMVIGSDAHINGNIISEYYIGLSSGSTVSGDACSPYVSSGAGSSIGGDGNSCNDVYGIKDQISKLSNEAASFDTIKIGSIDSDYSIDVSGNSVFDISDLNLDSGENLIINGKSGETVIINIYGNTILGSGSGIFLNGGITSSDVLFNFIYNPSAGVNIGAANISGTYLSDGRSIIIGDGATIDDTRFWSSSSIIANIQDIYFEDSFNAGIPGGDNQGNLVVPSVSIGNLFGIILLGFLLTFIRVRKKNVKR